jgi:hypothetical protein
MRKFTLRSVLILGAAFTLLAALAPSANADLIRFYDLEPPADVTYPLNLDSHSPALENDHPLVLTTGVNTTPAASSNYPAGNTEIQPPLGANLPPGAPASTTSLGFIKTKFNDLGVEINFNSAQGIYDITSVSFGYSSNGNGYRQVQLQVSLDGGAFVNVGGLVTLSANPPPGTAVTLPNNVSTLGHSLVTVRLLFVNGASNGVDHQFQLDNITVGGTIVPEPATVAGGLLGVLGLCWFQRKRLIRSVRFRRT